jgi:hypothetical protein
MRNEGVSRSTAADLRYCRARSKTDVDTQGLPGSERDERWRPATLSPIVPRRHGGRWKSIRAEARRRRLVANALVLGTTGAVVALAALFNHLLSR